MNYQYIKFKFYKKKEIGNLFKPNEIGSCDI